MKDRKRTQRKILEIGKMDPRIRCLFMTGSRVNPLGEKIR